MRMKHRSTLYLLVPLALLCACEIVDLSIPGVPRGYRTTTGGAQGNRSDSTGSSSTPVPPDTVVLACGVAFPEGYEWRKDTAMGAVPSRLVLYRDSSVVLSLPTGKAQHLNPFPDSHHLAGGHVYSEYTEGGHTWISRDGEPLFDYGGSEYLKGLAVRDGSVFSLGCEPATGDATLRKDGQPLLRISGGSVFGGFGDGVPALYEDSGQVCFAYSEGGVVHLARDGVVSKVSLPAGASAVEDFRIAGGEPCAVYENGGYVCCSYSGKEFKIMRAPYSRKDFHVVEFGPGAAVTGRFASGRTSFYSVCLRPWNSEAWSFPSGVNFLAEGPGGVPLGIVKNPFSVREAIPGRTAGGRTLYSFDGGFLISGGAAAVLGGHVYAGLTSTDGESPFLVKDGSKLREYPFNGFICGIEAELASSPDDSRPEAL